MRARLLLGIGVLFAGALGAATYLFFTGPMESGSIPEFKAEIAHSIRTQGPERAYAAFKTAHAEEEFSTRHNAAHVFGELLFHEAGFRGVGVCDADFNYGCYHGFMTEAIAKKGFASIPDLASACRETPVGTSCEHGIGHGIVEYLGHRNLLEALRACDATQQPDPIAGCLTGVFMEYNVPIVFDANGQASTEVRPLSDSENPYDVCPTLPSSYQPACYFSLPQWWRQVLGEDYAKMGALCAAAPHERKNCYAGIGNIVGPSAEFRAAQTIAWCDLMPETDGRTVCLLNAQGSFVQQSGREEDARTVCEAIPMSERRACMAY